MVDMRGHGASHVTGYKYAKTDEADHIFCPAPDPERNSSSYVFVFLLPIPICL